MFEIGNIVELNKENKFFFFDGLYEITYIHKSEGVFYYTLKEIEDKLTLNNITTGSIILVEKNIRALKIKRLYSKNI